MKSYVFFVDTKERKTVGAENMFQDVEEKKGSRVRFKPQEYDPENTEKSYYFDDGVTMHRIFILKIAGMWFCK